MLRRLPLSSSSCHPHQNSHQISHRPILFKNLSNVFGTFRQYSSTSCRGRPGRREIASPPPASAADASSKLSGVGIPTTFIVVVVVVINNGNAIDAAPLRVRLAAVEVAARSSRRRQVAQSPPAPPAAASHRQTNALSVSALSGGIKAQPRVSSSGVCPNASLACIASRSTPRQRNAHTSSWTKRGQLPTMALWRGVRRLPQLASLASRSAAWHAQQRLLGGRIPPPCHHRWH